MSWILWLLGGVSGLFKVISEALQMYRDKDLIDQGRQQAEAEIAAKIAAEQNAISKKQTDILMQERTEEELKKKLENGEF